MAHPFRKMTTEQLRRLLNDDRERNRILTEQPEQSDSNPSVVMPLKIQSTHPDHTKNISDSR
jgi:hypothetical protein